MSNHILPCWNPGRTKNAIVDFVERTTTPGSPSFVSPSERIAVFDNNGTLWCEKPIPIELSFVLQRLAYVAKQDSSLRKTQPWKAAFESDYGWLCGVVAQHYRGDDADLRVLMGGILRSFAGMTVGEYELAASAFVRECEHPWLHRRFRYCHYEPMIDLLRYLETKGFTTFIASGGDHDFMRSLAQEIYGISRDRVIGSSSALRYQESSNGGAIVYQGSPDVFDDGPTKAVRIWTRVGGRPIIAFGNSNGDIPMLRLAGGGRAPGFNCCSCMTTSRVSSITHRAQSARWKKPRIRGGTW
jgi:hypothetical protein